MKNAIIKIQNITITQWIVLIVTIGFIIFVRHHTPPQWR